MPSADWNSIITIVLYMRRKALRDEQIGRTETLTCEDRKLLFRSLHPTCLDTLHGVHPSHFVSFRFLQMGSNVTRSEAENERSKKEIQKKFWEEVGLIVDVPQHGSGTSNNGNTAGRFFQDSELTSSITGVDKVLIEKFGIILQGMTCGKRIDFIKFEEYCEETAKLYASLPVGQLTEEAQEANNKIFKRIREFNTRKISRMATNEDLGHKL